jgi:hypothetical protein
VNPMELRVEFIDTEKIHRIPPCAGCPALELPAIARYAGFSNGFGVSGSRATDGVLVTAQGAEFRDFLLRAGSDDRVFGLYGLFQRGR